MRFLAPGYVVAFPLPEFRFNRAVREAQSSNDVRVKPGRNDPCPCGSGKKYKNCHYALDAVAMRQSLPASFAAEAVEAADELASIIDDANRCLSCAITEHRLNGALPARGFVQLAVSFYGAMAHGAVQAVVALCRAGLEQQALVNYRCLVEFWTKAYYYGEFPRDAETFIASLDTSRSRLALLRGHRLHKPLREKVEAAAEAAREQHPRLSSWKEPSVEEMMSKLSAAMPPKDRQLAYFANYRFESSYAHGDITVLPNVLVSNDAGDRIVRLDNTKTGFANHTLRNAARIVMSLAQRVGDVHGVDLTPVLTPLGARIEALGDLGEAPKSTPAGASKRGSAHDTDDPGLTRAV